MYLTSLIYHIPNIITYNNALIKQLTMQHSRLPQFQQRLSFYRGQIRSQYIQKIKAQSRMEVIHSHTLAQVAQLSACNGDKEISPVELLEKCKVWLLWPFERKEGPSVQVLKMMPIGMHVTFWRKYLEFLNTKQTQSASAIPLLISLALKFKQLHSWTTLEEQDSQYANVWVEIIDTIVPDLSDAQRKQFAEWITEFDRIVIVKKLVTFTQDFPLPKQWPNFYNLLEQTLIYGSIEKQTVAADVITEIIKYANSAQNHMLFKQKPLIFEALFRLLKEHCHSKQSTFFWMPLLYLLISDSQCLLTFVKADIVAICARLITSELQCNLFGGLSLLHIISVSSSQKALSLFVNTTLSGQSSWLQSCFKHRIFAHPKQDIKMLFFQLLKNILNSPKGTLFLTWCFQHQITYFDLLQISSYEWDNGKDPTFLCLTLQFVLSLLLHQRQSKKQVIANTLQSTGLLKKIKELSQNTNQNVKEAAFSVLEIWEQSRRMDDL